MFKNHNFNAFRTPNRSSGGFNPQPTIRQKRPIAALTGEEEIIYDPTKNASNASDLVSPTVDPTGPKKKPNNANNEKSKGVDDRIIEAARSGNLELVKKLVEDSSCDIDVTCIGCTALHYAVFYNHRAIIEYLVANGANLDKQDFSGRTVVNWAIERGHSDIVKYLLECQAKPTHSDKKGLFPLHYAAIKGDVEIVRLLVEVGNASVNQKSTEEAGMNTPLHEACSLGNNDVVNYLLERGAEPNMKNGQSRNCLIRATTKQQVDTVKILLEHPRTEVNHPDVTGKSALHWAAFYGFFDLVKILVDAGANLKLKDKGGATPQVVAKKRAFGEISAYLEEQMATAHALHHSNR